MTTITVDPDEMAAVASALRAVVGELNEIAGDVQAQCRCCCVPSGAGDVLDAAAAVESGLGSVAGDLGTAATDLQTRGASAAADSLVVASGSTSISMLNTSSPFGGDEFATPSLDRLLDSLAIPAGAVPTGTGLSAGFESMIANTLRGGGAPASGSVLGGSPFGSIVDIHNNDSIWTVPSRDEVMGYEGQYVSPSDYSRDYPGGFDSTLVL